MVATNMSIKVSTSIFIISCHAHSPTNKTDLVVTFQTNVIYIWYLCLGEQKTKITANWFLTNLGSRARK